THRSLRHTRPSLHVPLGKQAAPSVPGSGLQPVTRESRTTGQTVAYIEVLVMGSDSVAKKPSVHRSMTNALTSFDGNLGESTTPWAQDDTSGVRTKPRKLQKATSPPSATAACGTGLVTVPHVEYDGRSHAGPPSLSGAAERPSRPKGGEPVSERTFAGGRLRDGTLVRMSHLPALANVPSLVVMQQKELLEIFTDFETKNRYAIRLPEGHEVLYAAETG